VEFVIKSLNIKIVFIILGLTIDEFIIFLLSRIMVTIEIIIKAIIDKLEPEIVLFFLKGKGKNNLSNFISFDDMKKNKINK